MLLLRSPESLFKDWFLPDRVKPGIINHGRVTNETSADDTLEEFDGGINLVQA
jgi:hypothetical protein